VRPGGALVSATLPLVHQKLVPQANELLQLLKALVKPGGMLVNHAGGCGGVGPIWALAGTVTVSITIRNADLTIIVIMSHNFIGLE